MGEPNRWLHVRLKREFTQDEFEMFCAHAEVWRDLVEAHLSRWRRLGNDYDPPKYEYFAPLLSADRRVATLPLGGEFTLGTRATFENGFSHFLWINFPLAFQLEAEEGITETIGSPPAATNWRPALVREPAPRSAGSIDPVLGRVFNLRRSRLRRVRDWLGEIALRL